MLYPYNSTNDCCGCKACESICPVNAIRMELKSDEFWYPVIDEKKCLGCNLCKKVCVENFSGFTSIDNSVSYIGKNNDNEVIKNSSSAGAFSALCIVLLNQGYSICGVVNRDNRVYHDFADNIEQCKAFRKSKYVQSDTSGVYEKVEGLLLNGRKVAFSGVSCQCAALYNYLELKRIPTDNLFVINILCHGVASQKIFFDYLQHERIIDYEFRYKHKQRNGKYNSKTARLTMINGKTKIATSISDAFLRAYSLRLFYRASCGYCKFACPERFTDITIADAWGAEKINSRYDAMSGLSLILLNSNKAKMLYSDISQNMSLEKVNNDWVINSQPLFTKSTSVHKSRSTFFEIYPRVGLKKAVYSIDKPSFYTVIKDYLKLRFK